MGSLLSSLEEKSRNAVLDSKLSDIKQAKKMRDLELATRIASTRDRLCWIAAYYSFVACVSGLRHISLHRRGVHMHWDNFFLPLNVVFICVPPFLFTYQLDLALSPQTVFGVPLGGKANRIAEEAQRIRDGTVHRWFGQKWLPEVDDSTLVIHRSVCLPLILEAPYRRDIARANAVRKAKGLAPERDWAYFEAGCVEKIE